VVLNFNPTSLVH